MGNSALFSVQRHCSNRHSYQRYSSPLLECLKAQAALCCKSSRNSLCQKLDIRKMASPPSTALKAIEDYVVWHHIKQRILDPTPEMKNRTLRIVCVACHDTQLDILGIDREAAVDILHAVYASRERSATSCAGDGCGSDWGGSSTSGAGWVSGVRGSVRCFDGWVLIWGGRGMRVM